jgi:PEP-CTERM motif
MPRRLWFFLVLGLLAPSVARAEALLRVTPEGWTPSDYQAAGYPTDPSIIGPDGFRLTYHGGGPDTLVDPVLLILGIADGTAAPTLTDTLLGGVTDVNIVRDGTDFFGGTWNANGFAGVFDSSAGNQSVYEVIGFTASKSGGADSENYSNWSAATGLTSWNLFVYQLYFAPQFGRGDFIEFSSNLSLPDGSFVIGYGLNTPKNGKQGVEATPFTFAGKVSVPEPGTLTLLIPALGLFGFYRRKYVA